MNSPLQNGLTSHPHSHASEETLRLIAKLPPPEGLVDRVQSRLRTAPPAAKLLGWPVALRPVGGWMHGDFVRAVAAASIVCVVAGGAWGIYMHVPPAAAPAAKVIVMPARVGSSGGFSSAGAMRTPDTLKGPVLTHNVKSESQQIEAVPPASNGAHKSKPGKTKKSPAPAAAIPVR